jgi:hypothetical protein
MRVSSVVLAFLLSAVSASAQLGPEQAVTSEPAQFPATIRAANHQLTAWTHPSTFEVRAVLDGTLLPVGQSHEFATAPVLAANDTTFLIVWLDPKQETLFGRRIAFDGSSVDAQPIAIGPASYYTSNESIVAIAEGSDYFVWWATDRALRVARLAGNTSTVVAERSWTASFGTPQIRAASVPRQPTHVFYGDDRYLPDIICDPFSCWNGFFGTFEPNGAGSIDPTELLGDAYQAGPIAVVSDGSRITLLWWGTVRNVWNQALFAAQFSPDLALLTAPKAIYVRPLSSFDYPPPALRAAWNGTETVVAWISDHEVRAIRLTRYADAIDREPFAIASGADPSSPPSVVPTGSGVLFTYELVDDHGIPHAFTRPLDRLPPGEPRRRATRH